MDTLRHYMRLYVLIEGQYIKSRMQYRADFIISGLGMIFSSIATVFVFWALFTSVSDIGGWSFDEVLFIYAFYSLSAAPMQIFFDHIWNLRYQVIQGSFIKYYLRPLNMLFYFISDRLDIKGIFQLLIGVVALVYASARLDLAWTPGRLALLLGALLGSSLVIISIMLIASCTAFWILDSFPVLTFAWRIREFAQYPLTIFDGFFRFIFTYLIPTGFVAFYPAQLFLRGGEAGALAYASPLVGVACFALAYWVWTRGVNHWTGTGS